MAVPTGFPLSPASSNASIRAFASGTATTDFAANGFIWSAMTGANPYSPTPTVKAGGTGTYIAAASAGVLLPTATVNVVDTTGFGSSGTASVMTTNGLQVVTYSGKTATSFTGCTGGTGMMNLGGEVRLPTTVPAPGQSAPIYCQNIRICNDGGTNALNYSFDGTNVAGQVRPNEQLVCLNRREAGIAVAAAAATTTFRIEAW